MVKETATTQKKVRRTFVLSHHLAASIVRAMQEKKGEEIVVMDMRQVSGLADYFILCSADSDLQVRALIEHIRKTVRETFEELPWSVEGEDFLQWVLMDYVNVVAHILTPEKRSFYELERLWGDAPMEWVEENQEHVKLLTAMESPDGTNS